MHANVYMLTGLILLTAISFSYLLQFKRMSLAVLHNEVVTKCKRFFVENCKRFSSTIVTSRNNFWFRQYGFKQRFNVISSGNWKFMLNLEVCDNNFGTCNFVFSLERDKCLFLKLILYQGSKAINVWLLFLELKLNKKRRHCQRKY